MSLTHDDLQAMRAIIEETINPVRGDIEALSNDVKEIYGMLPTFRNRIAIRTLSKRQASRKKSYDFTWS